MRSWEAGTARLDAKRLKLGGNEAAMRGSGRLGGREAGGLSAC